MIEFINTSAMQEKRVAFMKALFEGLVTDAYLARNPTFISCPHCRKILRVLRVEGPNSGTNPWTKSGDEYFVVWLADGFGARLWRTEP